MIEVLNGGPVQPLKEAVLFSFDEMSLPYAAGLRLHLVPGKGPGVKVPIVVRAGKPGEPDAMSVRYYGTVIQIGDKLHMWYQAIGSLENRKGGPRRMCYAVSSDGLNWEKPKLGVVEYNGSKDNNIVDLLGGECVMAASPVLYDPDDPDPNRRFKTVFECGKYGNRIAVAYSPDGFRWKESPDNPVGAPLEQCGLIRFNGVYYVNGQGGNHFGPGRKLVTYASYDFENWTLAGCLGLFRGNVPPRQSATEWGVGEEVHLGAGMWDRGNVVLGIYGMWHGHPTGDRSYLTMDLGFVVSNDALHFREPIPDFKTIPAFEEPEVPIGGGPALMQGQGMWNVGDQTLFWYESWRDGGVRLAKWRRDRLGYFDVSWVRPDDVPNQCISCPVRIGRKGVKAYVNLDGVSENSCLKVEVCDEKFYPIPGYTAADCVPLKTPGLRQEVKWRGGDVVRWDKGPIRLKVLFEGLRVEDVKFYALYLGAED